MIRGLIACVTSALLVTGCDGSSAGTASTSAEPAAAAATAAVTTQPTAKTTAASAAQGATKQDAEKLLRQLLDDKADAKAILMGLEPKAEDYAAVFEPSAAAAVRKANQAQFSQMKESTDASAMRKPNQTELLVWTASSEDIKAWTGEAATSFPGGYKGLGDKINGGLTWVRWKFVAPGTTTGMAYDGLVFVNGHWAWFPKPWRALR